MVKQKPFYQLVKQLFPQIVIRIVFQLMKTSRSERNLFQDDPNAFVNDVQRLLYENETVTLRQCANDLLVEMCELIDEVLNFVVELCLELLKIGLDPNHAIADHFKSLFEFSFFKQSTQIDLIETSFLVLCLVKMQLDSRLDLQKQMAEFHQANKEKFQ